MGLRWEPRQVAVDTSRVVWLAIEGGEGPRWQSCGAVYVVVDHQVGTDADGEQVDDAHLRAYWMRGDGEVTELDTATDPVLVLPVGEVPTPAEARSTLDQLARFRAHLRRVGS